MVAFFDDCVAKKENRNAYLAWVPGLWIWCYTTDDAAALGKPEVIKRCNAGFRKRYVVSGLSCNLLYDGERIVDPLIETIRRVYPPIPMTIGIFDAQTSKLQTTRGFFRTLPSGQDHSFKDPTPFQVDADGVVLCTGVILEETRNIDFSMTCFDTMFEGTTRPNKLVRTQGIYAVVPAVTRLTSDESWIEFRF